MFCPKCGGLLRAKEGSRTEFVCPSSKCGFEQNAKDLTKEGGATKVKIDMKRSRSRTVSGRCHRKVIPKTGPLPKCGHNEAYWYLVDQKSDEPEPPS